MPSVRIQSNSAGGSTLQKLRGQIRQQPVPIFLAAWFLLNLLQSFATELTSDEGYYWFYSTNLQWGYYDHPPMVALMIKAGRLVFPDEAGVRFFNVLFSTGAVYFFLKILPGHLLKNKSTYGVLLSAPLLHYLSIIVFPDGPLLFFSMLFLFLYKQHLQKQTWLTSLAMGLALAGMAYSKYHGALVLLFVIIADTRVLKNRYFLMSLFVAAICFIPHLWWQYQNNFPTFHYHLSGRTGNWSFRFVTEYLSQQLIALGPGLVFAPLLARKTAGFERTLKVIFIGSLVFFLISSFKTFVHFHWTSIALFPLLYFAIIFYNGPSNKKLFRLLVLPFVFLFLAARVALAFPIIENLHVGEDYFHGRKEWANAIDQIAGSKPVFIPNNLREASLYSFYSANTAVTLYTRPGKKSQYELWGYEDSLKGKDVLMLTKYPAESSDSIYLLNQPYYYQWVPAFTSFYTKVQAQTILVNQTDSTLLVNVVLKLTGDDKISGNDLRFIYQVEDKKDLVTAGFVSFDKEAKPGGPVYAASIPIGNLAPGNYQLVFGIRQGTLPDAIISQPLSFRVKK